MNVFRKLCIAIACLSFASLGFSDASPKYIEAYNGTGNNHNTTVYTLDYSGNVYFGGSITAAGQSINNGTETSNGLTVYSPSTVFLSSTSAITPTSTFVDAESTGAVVLLGGAACTNVAISTATAINGQFLVLGSTSTTSYIQISTGTQCGVVGPTATISLLNKSSSFIFDALAGVWKQLQQ